MIFGLFRTKSLIADQLPTKTDKVVFCPLTETQRQAYENLMECEDIELIKRRGENCDCGSGKARGGCCHSTNEEGKPIVELIFPYSPLAILIDNRYMMYVQKLSNHLALMIPRICPIELSFNG
jgi:DNA excision repair protein ERCC-6-like 2